MAPPSAPRCSFVLGGSNGCHAAVFAVGPAAVDAAEDIRANGLVGMRARPGMAVEERQGAWTALVMVDLEAGRDDALGELLAEAQQTSSRVVVVGEEESARRVVQAAKDADVPIVVVLSGNFLDAAQAICAPWMLPGMVGINGADGDFLFQSGRTARVTRWEIGDWSQVRVSRQAGEAVVSAPAGQTLRALLLSVFTDVHAQRFALLGISGWYEQVLDLLGDEVDVLLSVTDHPGSRPYALVTAFAEERRAP